MNKPSIGTTSGSSINPCVISQSVIVILVPFSNLNGTFAMGILFRSVIGLLTTTSMGIPTLSLQVNWNLLFEKCLARLAKNCTQEANQVGVQVTVMLVCLVITNAQVILSWIVIKLMMVKICNGRQVMWVAPTICASCFQLQTQSDFLGPRGPSGGYLCWPVPPPAPKI